MTTDDMVKKVKDLSKIRLLLAQDEDGLEEYVYPRLKTGDVWWIPDEVSGFGSGQRHPWVIVRGFSIRGSSIVACPRTTSLGRTQRGIVTPAGILPSLDQKGLILLRFRRTFVAKAFRDFDYAGRLSDDWIQKMQSFYKALTKGKATR